MSGKCKFSLAVTLFFVTFMARAEVVINEVMPCNISTKLNDNYNYSGWVEFYNNGTDVVNLKGYEVSCYNEKGIKNDEKKWSWLVPYDCTIEAGKYKVIYFDKQPPEAEQAPIPGHAPYKVDVDGGQLLLVDAMGGFVSSLTYSPMYPHVAFGKGSNGVDNYMVPTPGKENGVAYPIAERCATPTFDGTKPGIFSTGSKGSISLACATAGATIYYTTDGSIPDENDKVYSKPISFDTTVCIRARAFKEGKIFSPIITGSFIFPKKSYCGEGKDAPIVSITSDDENFFGDKLGIYHVGTNGATGEKSCVGSRANYNQDWDRPVNFEYFVNKKQVVSQEAEVAIMGGCSRQWDLKSLKITTGKKTGNELFVQVDNNEAGYPFFNAETSKVGNVYSSLQLRNGGNGAEGEGRIKVRDGFMQSIAKRMGNIDYQAYQPVSFYFNGEYMGLMGLRERTNKTFVEANYGYDEDEIDVIEITQAGYAATCGDTMAYSRLIAFATQNYEKEDFLLKLNDYMDVEEYINYMIFEQFVVNTDWPGNNCKMWRHRADGKFRWISFDTDFGLGLYDAWGENYCDVESDMIDWCLGEGNKNWANTKEWITLLFRSLMKNEDFKQMLLTKYMMHLGTIFQEEEITFVWDSIVNEVGKEFCREFGHEYYEPDLKKKGEGMFNFAVKRTNKIYEQLAERYALTNKLVELNLSCDNEVAGFYINNAEIAQNSYSLKCLEGMNVVLAAKLPEGYSVKKWVVNSKDVTDPTVTLSVDDETEVVLYVEKADVAIPSIVINEICSKNTFWEDASGSKPDWIELFNAGETAVDVAGLYLSDNPDNLLMHKIPSGYSSSIIAPGGYMLLWADDVKGTSPIHVGFKLSDLAGETITLSKVVDGDSVIIIDQVAMKGAVGENKSFGRVTDGAADFQVFDVCANGFGNSATPGAQNGSIDCDELMRENSVLVNFDCEYAGATWMINGTEQTSDSYTALKNKNMTMKPVYPPICQFDYWEVSREYQTTEAVLTSSSSWSYFYSDTIPADDWFAPEYDDAEWSTGYGRFGYSDDSRSYDTELDYGEVDSMKYITAYFRNQFDIDNFEKMDSLLVTLTYDDAAVIYVNGKEINRYNITSDSISYNTLANTYIDERTENIYISKSLLKEKDNVIAIEIHQSGGTSSDMTFSMNAETSFMTNVIKTEELTFTPKNDLTFTLHLIFNEEPTPSKVYLSANTEGCGFVVNETAINSLTDTIDCMTGDRIYLSPIIPDGYMFDCWDINGNLVYTENADYVQIKETVVKLKVKKIILPALLLNEISIANVSKTSNWVEIFNNVQGATSLANIYISNTRSDLLLYNLSGSMSEKSHALYWADGGKTPSHLPFEIAEGDTLYLSAVYNKKTYPLDSVVCKSHVPDGSYGRTADGNKNWTAFAFCIDDLTSEATPGSKNGSVDCANEILKNQVIVRVEANADDLIYLVNGDSVQAEGKLLEFVTYKNKDVSIEPYTMNYKFSHWGESTIISEETDTITLADSKTVWSYFYDSIAPAEDWNTIDFDASDWKTGKGKFGYKSNVTYDTPLDYGDDSQNKYITAYFRYEFDIEDVSQVDFINCEFLYDDAMVMYVNGVECLRYNIEQGVDTASDYIDDQKVLYALNSDKLVTGKNVICVEVHQYNGQSSDLTFKANAEMKRTIIERSNTIDEEVPAVFVAAKDTTIMLTVEYEEGYDPTGIEVDVIYVDSEVSIYPNPATDFVMMEVQGENSFNYTISDLFGRIIDEGYCNCHKKQLNLSNITPGVYIIQIVGEKVKHQGKLIKK